jgi:ParB-like chromosome segregation protein Spo0J
MIPSSACVHVERIPLSHLHVTEYQPRYVERLLHYIEAMRRHPDAYAGFLSVQPSTQAAGMYEVLDGHHRYCAAIMTGKPDVLCVVVEELPAPSCSPEDAAFHAALLTHHQKETPL